MTLNLIRSENQFQKTQNNYKNSSLKSYFFKVDWSSQFAKNCPKDGSEYLISQKSPHSQQTRKYVIQQPFFIPNSWFKVYSEKIHIWSFPFAL